MKTCRCDDWMNADPRASVLRPVIYNTEDRPEMDLLIDALHIIDPDHQETRDLRDNLLQYLIDTKEK